MTNSATILRTMLDQIDGDPLATQFFDARLIERARAAVRLDGCDERHCTAGSVPTYRCNICGGIVRYDGTSPQAEVKP